MTSTRSTPFVAALVVSLAVAASPARAHDERLDGYWLEPTPADWSPPPPPAPFRVDPALAERLERCGRVHPSPGLGGALIGGAVGGLVGNRLAPGNRVVGTVAGAAVGAAAGAAIERAEDRARIDDCAALFEQGYDYPGGYYLIPVSVPSAQPCEETVTTHEEWVPEPAPRQRRIPPRARPRDKRIKL